MALYALICELAVTHNTTSPPNTEASDPPQPQPRSFYRIPSNLVRVKPRAYLPRVVSIGLIHASTEMNRKQDMENLKKKYMFSLFNRSKFPATRHTTPWDCAEAIEKLAEEAIKSYPVSTEDRLGPQTTAEILLIDGCFILELLLITCCPEAGTVDSNITNNRLMLKNIKHDLLLLENQIPFFVLVELYKLTVSRFQIEGILPLEKLILKFFGNRLNCNFKFNLNVDRRSQNEEVDHILGLLHSCYYPGDSKPGEHTISKYSAAELHRSGVNVKPSKPNREVYLHVDFKNPCLFQWYNSISYRFKKLPKLSKTDDENIRCCVLSIMCQLCCKATLEIPELCITDSTESFMRNLIAYEQCTQHVPRYMTSYAFLMDTLINSKEHVEMLETSGVLKNYLGSGEDASNLFNSLCQEVDLADFYFSRQWEKTDAYYRLYWPSRMASLRRTYFSNPWTSISLVAALILFTFTCIQTICALITVFRRDL